MRCCIDVAPPPPSNRDLNTAIEEAPGIAPLPVQTLPFQFPLTRPTFLSSKSRSDRYSHSTRNTLPSKPGCLVPPCPARHLQEWTTNPSFLNEEFSEDEGDNDIDERSLAPSTARRTSIFKNLAPPHTFILSMAIVRALRVPPVRLSHSKLRHNDNSLV